MFSEYDFNDTETFVGIGHKISKDINTLRTDVVEVVSTQTEKQVESSEKATATQITLFGKLIDMIRSIFTGKNESGKDESFYEMVTRESNETQEYMRNGNETTGNKLTNIIDALKGMSSEISNNSDGDSRNSKLIADAIESLKLIKQ